MKKQLLFMFMLSIFGQQIQAGQDVANVLGVLGDVLDGLLDDKSPHGIVPMIEIAQAAQITHLKDNLKLINPARQAVQSAVDPAAKLAANKELGRIFKSAIADLQTIVPLTNSLFQYKNDSNNTAPGATGFKGNQLGLVAWFFYFAVEAVVKGNNGIAVAAKVGDLSNIFEQLVKIFSALVKQPYPEKK